ncbi:anthranilate synthase component I family protein [Glycomyces algeriensis]|uniref:Anthranilate synthase component I n=1 Tax=Glycomyces algeriensis TaxID=256037 RepID=A0A9W6GAD6_9ACTN|nr:anthranilate synthase component I family protein [Glycomyces algeriensis]MDA1364378.1 anthranilate synthase component I family protein [Glycomyces algeriensis]MDR7350411.1 anthranilate synthase component 1 [Glycomyces algeriensis]GLI43118.1 anthranilate synthase component I [Glycomyces algeriensis]
MSAAADRPKIALRRFLSKAEDPFASFIRLRAAEGEQNVFLFESLAGPAADKTRAMIGATPLLDVVVRDGVLELDGRGPWLDWALRRMAGFGGARPEGERFYRLHERTALWEALRHLESGLDVDGLDDQGFGFGFVALLSYDAVTYIETLPRLIEAHDRVPDAVFRIYRSVIEIDLVRREAQLHVAHCPDWDEPDPADVHRGIEAALATEAAQANQVPEPPLSDVEPELTITPESYGERVERSLERIRAGDIYQVQIGHEVRMRGKRSDLDVYLRMRANNPSPYMGFVPFDDLTLLSASPELHVRIEADHLTMRPIAGTARRGATAAEDEARAARLRGDEKEIAEHIMLVDLCRNDLGRVADPGSVEVDDLMNVEAYSHVLHLVSTVTADLAAGFDAYDVIRATFPAGTMTGAPKLRAMEIIETTETSRRGMYAGAFGVIGFGGFTNLALSIRTIVATGDAYTARASAGVVADSSPQGEWRETLAKLGSSIHAVVGHDAATDSAPKGDTR